MHNPIMAIVAAALAAWIFGAVWYTALGRAWQAAQGKNPDDCKGQKMPLTAMLASFLAVLLMAWVFSYLLSGLGAVGWQSGALTGLFLGVAFMAVPGLVNNLFQQRSLKLSLIDGAHWIGVAVIEGAILCALA